MGEGTSAITVTPQDADGNRVSDAFDMWVLKAREPDEPSAPPTGSPTVAAPLADIRLEATGHWEISLTGMFSGDGLTFTAASSNYGEASMWVNGSTLTVVGVSTVTATVTVTAEEPKGDRVSDAFEVR